VAWECWQGVQSQWRVGPGGPTGLDYAGVRAYLDEAGLAADERKGAFDGIRACELAMLDVWRERREEEDMRREAESLQRDLAARTGR
jgi:hypothetical protein